MLSILGAILTFTLGTAILGWGVAVRDGTAQQGLRRALAAMPAGAAQEGA